METIMVEKRKSSSRKEPLAYPDDGIRSPARGPASPLIGKRKETFVLRGDSHPIFFGQIV